MSTHRRERKRSNREAGHQNDVTHLFETALSNESGATVAGHCTVQTQGVAFVAAPLVTAWSCGGWSIRTRRVQQGCYFGVYYEA